jgi:hypothetical protein
VMSSDEIDGQRVERRGSRLCSAAYRLSRA